MTHNYKTSVSQLKSGRKKKSVRFVHAEKINLKLKEYERDKGEFNVKCMCVCPFLFTVHRHESINRFDMLSVLSVKFLYFFVVSFDMSVQMS